MILYKLRSYIAKQYIAWKYNNIYYISPYHFDSMLEIDINYLRSLKKDLTDYHDISVITDGRPCSDAVKECYKELIDNLKSYYNRTYKSAKKQFDDYAHKRRVLNYLAKHNKLNSFRLKECKDLNKYWNKWKPQFDEFPEIPDISYFVKMNEQDNKLKEIEDDFK